MNLSPKPTLSAAPGAAQSPWRAAIWRWLSLLLSFLLIAVVGYYAWDYGHPLRRDAFLETGKEKGNFGKDIHFILNLQNPIDWGRDVYRGDIGFQDVYDELLRKFGEDGDFGSPTAPIQLDYPPMRLLIAALWADWAGRYHPLTEPRSLVVTPDGTPLPIRRRRRPLVRMAAPLTVQQELAELLAKNTPWLRQLGEEHQDVGTANKDLTKTQQANREWLEWLPGYAGRTWVEYPREGLPANMYRPRDRPMPISIRRPLVLTEEDEYNYTEPMLLGNEACEAVGAVGMFLLVRFWVRQCSGKIPAPAGFWSDISQSLCPPKPWIGLLPGLAAGLMFWFNPAIIWSGHCFPQWDAWLLPPFVLAVYLCLNGGWLTAGVLLGVAAMAKGQMLIVAPVLFIWPLVQLRLGCVLKMAVGFFLGIGAVVCLWLIPDLDAAITDSASLSGIVHHLLPDAPTTCWVASVLLAALVLAPVFFIRARGYLWRLLVCALAWLALALLEWWYVPAAHFDARRWIIVAIAVTATLVRWVPTRFIPTLIVGVGLMAARHSGVDFNLAIWAWLLIAGMVSTAGLLPRRAITTWAAASIAGALALCPCYFNGSMGWYKVGIAYGARHWKTLAWRWPTNLAGLLQTKFDWNWYVPGDPTKEQIIDLTNYLPFLKPPVIVLWWYVLGLCVVVWMACCYLAGLPWVRKQTHRMIYRTTIGLGFLNCLLPVYWLLCKGWTWDSYIDLSDYFQLPIRDLMLWSYGLCLALCGIAIAVQHDRRDRRLLFALATPWLLAFALLPQMQPRYLMWPAAFFTGAAAVGLDGLLVCAALVGAAVLNMLRDLYMGGNPGREWPPDDLDTITMRASHTVQHWLPVVANIYPDLGWGILALALCCMFLIWRSSSRQSKLAQLLRLFHQPGQHWTWRWRKPTATGPS